MKSQKYYLYKRSNGYWYIGYLINRRRAWKSSGTKRKNEALKILTRFDEQAKHDFSEMTFSEFEKQFILQQTTNLRDSTIKRIYSPAFLAFKKICGDKLLTSYSLKDVEIYKKIRSEACAPTTVNIEFRTLRAAFNVAIQWKFIQENPFVKSKQLKFPVIPPLYLSKEEIQKVLATVREPLLKDLFTIAVLTGMRQGEILNLTWDKVNLENKQICITNNDNFMTKNGSTRIIPMNDQVCSILTRRNHEKNSNTFVFEYNSNRLLPGYVQSKFKKYIRAIGLNDKLHFHSLRHTFATWLVQGGVNIYEVQKLLGHSSVRVTEIYSHLAASELHSAVNKIFLPLN